MPRPHRIKGNDIHYHIILRCNNKEPLLQNKEDFEKVLTLLAEGKREFSFRLYNYELLNSHIHLMLSTHNDYFVDQIIHNFCFKFAKGYNQKYKRSGHFWAHRYRSRLILNDSHGLACLRYQHRNAFSAGIVSKPEDWPWSGYSFYAYNAYRQWNHLLEFHPSYLSLARDDEDRRSIYRKLVLTPIPSDKVKGLFDGRGSTSSCRFETMLDQVARRIKDLQ